MLVIVTVRFGVLQMPRSDGRCCGLSVGSGVLSSGQGASGVLRWMSRRSCDGGIAVMGFRFSLRWVAAAASTFVFGIAAVGCGSVDPPACSGCSYVKGSVRVCRGSSSRSCSPASTSAVVSARNRRHRLVGSERVASGGYYELALPTSGQYFITATFGKRTETRTLSIRREQTRTIDLVLASR